MSERRKEGVKAPFRYEPSGDCDGERYGIDHFVLDADDNELARAPNEATGRLLAAAPELLAALKGIQWIDVVANGVTLWVACVSCHNLRKDGHKDSCLTAGAILKAEGSDRP